MADRTRCFWDALSPRTDTDPATCSTSQFSHGRRGSEQWLFHEGNVVAKGRPHTSHQMLHGHQFNVTTHTVVEITFVLDTGFVPQDHNPFGEPLSIGQFVLWQKLAMTMDSDDSETPHKKARFEAEAQYLKAAAKQKHRYDMLKVIRDFDIGDTVGIRIHAVDRANTDGRIIPCKVKDKLVRAGTTLYRIYSASGIIKNCFKSDDLADLKSVAFPALDNADPATLPEITVVTAARQNVAATSKELTSVCGCKGRCNTLKCKCKKSKLQCSTKCHPSNVSCKNK